MTEPLTIVIPFDVGICSPNRRNRQVWQERKRAADAAKEAATLAWRLAGSPVVAVPVAVSVTIRRARQLDPDALLSSCKGLVDALFVGRITPTDSAAWVEFVAVRQETGSEWRETPEVVFRVFPRETAAADEDGCPAAALEIEEEDEPQVPRTRLQRGGSTAAADVRQALADGAEAGTNSRMGELQGRTGDR